MTFDSNSAALFARHVNKEFRLSLPEGGAVSLTLESVEVSIDEATQFACSLLFRSSDPDLPSGLYRLANDDFGECTLHVSPVRVRRGQVRHEAVINLLLPEPASSFPAEGPENSNPK